MNGWNLRKIGKSQNIRPIHWHSESETLCRLLSDTVAIFRVCVCACVCVCSCVFVYVFNRDVPVSLCLSVLCFVLYECVVCKYNIRGEIIFDFRAFFRLSKFLPFFVENRKFLHY